MKSANDDVRTAATEEDTNGISDVSGVLSASMSGEIKFGIVFVVPQENTPMNHMSVMYRLFCDFIHSILADDIIFGESKPSCLNCVTEGGGGLALNPFSVNPSNVTQIIMLTISFYRKTSVKPWSFIKTDSYFAAIICNLAETIVIEYLLKKINNTYNKSGSPLAEKIVLDE